MGNDQEAKGQVHTRPKIDLEARRNIILDPFWSSSFSKIFYSSVQTSTASDK